MRAFPGVVAPIRLASEKARLTATMDFPTPPLQEETAMMVRTPERPVAVAMFELVLFSVLMAKEGCVVWF